MFCHKPSKRQKKHLQKKFSRIQTAHIKAIGIDEIHVGKGMQNQQYLTIIRDLQSGAVIHVGEGAVAKPNVLRQPLFYVIF